MNRLVMPVKKSTVVSLYYVFLLLPPLFGVVKAAIMALDPWRIGEWLISYPNEFVRRGLFGEALGVFNLSGNQRIVIIAVTQIVIYLPLGLYVFWHLKKSGFSNDCIAFAFGPASIAFFSWDHEGFGRKEGAGIAALIMLALAKQNSKVLQSKILLSCGVSTFLVSILISEINLVFLPSALYLILNNETWISLKSRIVVSCIATSGSAALALLAIINGGSEKTSKVICEEIVEIGLDESVCGGAIKALGLDAKDGFDSNVALYPQYILYFFLLAWGLIPTLTSEWIKGNKSYFFVTLCFTLPLFIVASDYGRWIFMLNIQLVICIFASGLTENCFSKVGLAKLLLFLFLFSIPHSNIQTKEILLGPIQSVISYIGALPDVLRVA